MMKKTYEGNLFLHMVLRICIVGHYSLIHISHHYGTGNRNMDHTLQKIV